MTGEQQNRVEVEESSGNVFADLGLPDPEERLLKAQLAAQIQVFIGQKGLTEAQIAAQLGLDQPKVSKLLRGHLADFSVDRLLLLLNRLGHSVEVRISAEEHEPQDAQVRVLVA
jgi:predicted XRE-type DNA-binding protein